MNDSYLQLFDYYCVPYEHLQFPEELAGSPIRAYGMYAFEEGFKLALRLAVPVLSQNDFDPHK